MARPEFPLESLLRYRRRREEERQLELAALQKRLEEERAALGHLEDRRARALEELRAGQTSPRLDLDEIGYSLAYLSSLATAVAAQEQLIVGLGEQVEEARERLLEARRSVKMVERLEEVWLEEQRLDFLKREEKAAGEAATSQFHRRASEA